MQPREDVHARDGSELTLSFDQITKDDLALVGGKGANLGAMWRADIPVPPGFCVTSLAFERFIAGLDDAERWFSALDALDGTDVDRAREAASAMREALGSVAIPTHVAEDILRALDALGAERSFAVRSSATAEDLPGASFAGQQDTYLNIRGRDAVLDAVRRCWISLFTDRAVLYRAKNRFGHRAVKLCVVVQRLVEPDVSGIMFTADPVSGHRATLSIDAGFGLGEALVSGLISADLYRYDRRKKLLTLAQVGDKAFAIRSDSSGGTLREELSSARRTARALSDEQVHALAQIAERVEAFYEGAPQDIEWCIRGGEVFVVQSRPITSLFPVPQSSRASDGLRVFVSFGHVQMMLDPIPTMALDLWRFFLPVGKGAVPDREQPAQRSPYGCVAGSRMFIDVTDLMTAPKLRQTYLGVLSHVYRDLALGIEALSKRENFQDDPWSFTDIVTATAALAGPIVGRAPYLLARGAPADNAREAARILDEVVARAQSNVASTPEGGDRIRRIAHEFNSFFVSARPALSRVITGILAHRALTKLAREPWAEGVRDEVENLLRGLPGNVTTEMDLAIGDLSDRARESDALVELLRASAVPYRELRAELQRTDGGSAFLHAFDRLIDRYGDRGVAEIDVSRPRWRDDPSLLLRVITGGLASSRETGAHRTHHEQQVAIGERAVERLTEAAKKGATGPMRARLVRRLATVARTGMALREHPKFALVRMLGQVRATLLLSGKTLLDRGQIDQVDDVFHLDIDELADALDDRATQVRATIRARRAQFEQDRHRKPPFVISSEGETPVLEFDRTGLGANALVGTAASAGVIEGVARIIRDPNREVLHSGEILVAECTDPGWTPLFVHASGVVTEVGGLMTHGAVVAREYGIPAVVSVRDATSKIATGQRIRVDGTRGVVEPLEESR